MSESNKNKAVPKHVIHTFSQNVFEQLAETGGDIAVIQLDDDSLIPATCTSLNAFALEEIREQCPDTQVLGKGGHLLGLYPAADLKKNGWDNQEKIVSYIELKHSENNMITGLSNVKLGRKGMDSSFVPCPVQNYTL